MRYDGHADESSRVEDVVHVGGGLVAGQLGNKTARVCLKRLQCSAVQHRRVGLDAAHGVVVGGFCLSESLQKMRLCKKEGKCAGKRVRRGASHLHWTVVSGL